MRKDTLIFRDLLCSIAGDKIKKNEMGGACIAFRGGERNVQGFGGET
jgi:hypothetical protein